tara:strand:- start:2493 stop:2696 length:204 start_codon:yes stop_codon:yes gene_type:complete
MKVGDVVNFYTGAWVFENANERYRNPGVIVEVDREHRQSLYVVLWADGKITKEYSGYLEKEEKNANR